MMYTVFHHRMLKRITVDMLLILLMLIHIAPISASKKPASCAERHSIYGPVSNNNCYVAMIACFAAAGFTFGTVPGAIILSTPALAACNAVFHQCLASMAA